MNPYWGTDFWEFLMLFFSRIPLVLTGKLPMQSDEVQIFTLVLLGLSTSIIGVFLVLKKMTMQANAISHTALLGIALVAIAFSLGLGGYSPGGFLGLKELLFASLITAIITQSLTRFISKRLKLQEDASIGLVFTLLFGLGVLLITMYTKNLHLGVEAIMGNIDALHPHDVKIMFFVFLLNLIVTTLLYSNYKMLAFDPGYAKSLGLRTRFFEMTLMLQTSLTIMAGFRAVGVILVLAYITAPILMMRFMSKRMYQLIGYSSLISAIIALISVAFSRHILSTVKLPISTAGLNVVFLLLFFISFATLWLVKKKYSKSLYDKANQVGYSR